MGLSLALRLPVRNVVWRRAVDTGQRVSQFCLFVRAASFVAGGLSVDSLQSEIKVKREGRNHGRPDLEGTRVTI